MPELPEVEATRLSLVSRIEGAQIKDVRLGKPLRWPLGCNPALLRGRQIVTVRRRGKYLLLDLDQGLLLLHLGMSGSLAFLPMPVAAGVHDHFDLLTSQGMLRLHDPRRFGAVVYASAEASATAQKLLAHLGTEPLSQEFAPKKFWEGLQKRRAPIKQVLLAGELVVGVGNIYASEALFAAGIRPTTPACELSLARTKRLHQAIQQVLSNALQLGGSTLRNFSNAQGQAGHFQLQAMVYGREHLPCRRCGRPIELIRQGQRASYFCAHCQKP